MANGTNRWASLRSVRQPDLRGWTLVGADGRKIGQVIDLLADPRDDEARFLAVDLDQTAIEQNPAPSDTLRESDLLRLPADQPAAV